MLRILLVEDEQPIRDLVRFALSREGIDMYDADSVEQARKSLQTTIPDLILLDWMLPDGSGLSLLRELRKDFRLAELPVILLTAKASEENKINGLESGADDYVTKPFSPKELIARIRALIRRSTGQSEDGLIKAGELALDPIRHLVTCHGKSLSLGPTEYRLLAFFLSHSERVYNRSQLLDFVWSVDSEVEERTVDVSVLRLRKVLQAHGCEGMVQTVRGIGYRFGVPS